MGPKRQVILVHAPDANGVAASICHILSEEAVDIASARSPLPDPWDEVVILFVLSDEALADTSLAAYAREIAERNLPLVPVVDNLRTYRFSDLPSGFDALRQRNACGLQPGDGEGIRTAVQANLGLPTFTDGKKVFISYCRSDGKKPCDAVYNLAYQDLSDCQPAFFICGDRQMTAVTEKAVQWTCLDCLPMAKARGFPGLTYRGLSVSREA